MDLWCAADAAAAGGFVVAQREDGFYSHNQTMTRIDVSWPIDSSTTD